MSWTSSHLTTIVFKNLFIPVCSVQVPYWIPPEHDPHQLNDAGTGHANALHEPPNHAYHPLVTEHDPHHDDHVVIF